MSLRRKLAQKYTYSDYLTWPSEERWELIAGQAYAMTPAPSTRHQRVVVRFSTTLETALAGRSCVVFTAPTDVVLSPHDVVQPDVLVVCEGSKITKENIQGAPDLVVEVLSPATARKDRKEKKALYQRFGVKEYVLIDPDGQYVERFWLDLDGTFSKGDTFAPQEVLRLRALEGMEIPLWEVFEVQVGEATHPGNHA
jgi:Uma2 family endonuclease